MATKIDEYVPTITPIIKANANCRNTSPPKKYYNITTISVGIEVTTVRFKVSLSD